jgi:hypothetical protein
MERSLTAPESMPRASGAVRPAGAIGVCGSAVAERAREALQ